MFTIEMLPASHGDCLWLEYGTIDRPHHVLIDGGPAYSYDALTARLEARFADLPSRDRHLELLVITHVDSDHIGGVLEFLLDNPLGITVGDVWFNAWKHLPGAAPDALGAVQGERVSELLEGHGLPWNKAFDGDAVVVPTTGDLPVIELAHGLKLTLLSPTTKELKKLRPKWKKTVEAAERVAGAVREQQRKPPDALGEEELDPRALAQERFKPDYSVANGSSIALLAEVTGASCLLAGDALTGVLAGTVARLATARGESRLEVDALKISHHGGRKNTSTELLERLRCQQYLFSTDGSRYQHPHLESVARTILAGGDGSSLYFNYRTKVNNVWDDNALKWKFGYRTVFPQDGEEGLVVTLS